MKPQKNADVQALVYSGFSSLRHARFRLLRITNAGMVRRWLRRADVCHLIKHGAQTGSEQRTGEALAIAFSYCGLRAMGLTESDEYPFPSAFRSGMNQPDRAQALGDDDVASWLWGDLPQGERKAVHVLLAHYSGTPFVTGGPLDPDILERSGFEQLRQVKTCASYIEPAKADRRPARLYEPFGFRDGLSQPTLRPDNPPPTDNIDIDHEVAEGEFILGLVNEYGDRSYEPDARGWLKMSPPPRPRTHFGTHGTYVAVRQILQDVAAFKSFDQANPRSQPDAPSLVEKMVGRYQDGRPLIVPPPGADPVNGFRYRQTDAEGFACPIGAHVRRGNPRDTLGWDTRSGIASSKLHRLLRRARVYTEGCRQAGACACADTGKRDCGTGLFFMAINADLDRQFEFIQQRWIGNRQFGDLNDEQDPLLGNGRGRFTVPGPAVGLPCPSAGPFTRVEAGGYFFLPGMDALRFLATDPHEPTEASADIVLAKCSVDQSHAEPRQQAANPDEQRP